MELTGNQMFALKALVAVTEASRRMKLVKVGTKTVDTALVYAGSAGEVAEAITGEELSGLIKVGLVTKIEEKAEKKVRFIATSKGKLAALFAKEGVAVAPPEDDTDAVPSMTILGDGTLVIQPRRADRRFMVSL